jgi:hypothetical protein
VKIWESYRKGNFFILSQIGLSETRETWPVAISHFSGIGIGDMSRAQELHPSYPGKLLKMVFF